MNKFKGIILVSIGAASYGILATTIKLGNNLGFGTAGLTFLQYLFGVLVLTLASFFMTKKTKEVQAENSISKNPKSKLILYGTTLGFTSSFYYLSIQYVPVSVGIILLMQSVWMGILLEFFIDRKLVSSKKLIGGGVVLIGTILASRVFESDFNFSFIGFFYGFLAAISYTLSLYASNKVSLQLPNITRSKYLVLGGFISTILFWNVGIWEDLNSLALIKWGIILGLFGTVLPPVLFNKGVPYIGNGLTSIISTLEIPVSITSAYLLLHEEVGIVQVVGIVIILVTILVINIDRKKRII